MKKKTSLSIVEGKSIRQDHKFEGGNRRCDMEYKCAYTPHIGCQLKEKEEFEMR